MERKTFSKVQIYVRNSYNQAGKLADSGNYAEAVEVLLPVIKANPEVSQLFERIRECEVAGFKKQNIFLKLFGFIASLFVAPVAALLSFIDPVKAMALCEGPLAMCVDNPIMLWTMFFVSNAADAPWGAVTALNVIRKLHPKNTSILRPLADAMQRNNQAGEALRLHQEMINNNPNNLALKDELRSAMALASLERGKWEENGSTQDKAADAKDAVLQQLLEGTIHDANQAQILIDKFTEDLKKTDSVDMRRKLAEAYMVSGKFSEAYHQLELVSQKLGIQDPTLDKDMEKAFVADLDQQIGKLKEQQGTEAQIAELEAKRDNYRAEHIMDRAKKFPNDPQLQFDLGELYFERGELDTAEEIFTQTAEFAQKKRAALVYLGRCALLKDDGEEAAKNLETAVNDMYRMDKYKREALYYLSLAYEKLGRNAEAMENYKKIGASMSNYRDIQERMAKLQEILPPPPPPEEPKKKR